MTGHPFKAGTSLNVGVLAGQLAARVPGGTGRYTRELLRGLAATADPLSTLTAVTGPRQQMDLAVNVRRLATPWPALARLWEHGLPPTITGLDVIHAPTLLVPPARGGARLVVTIHDTVPWSHPETLTTRGAAFHRRMGRRASAQADLIITPTDAVATQVVDVLEPRCPVVTISPGMTALAPPADQRQRRLRLQLPDRYILFVGTAEPRKGLDVLIRAMTSRDLRASRLVVVGPKGWGDADPNAMAAAAGVADRVIVTGPVSDQDLASIYAAACVLAMPSRAEGFGLPVLEAMALGIPVVTSDDAALVEVGGDATLCTPVGDADALAHALAQAAEPGELSARMGARGTLRAGHYDWQTSARKLWTLYASLR